MCFIYNLSFPQLLSVTDVNTKGVKKVIYSTKAILIVIGIVLGIYLLGYFLIVSSIYCGLNKRDLTNADQNLVKIFMLIFVVINIFAKVND